MLSIIFKTLLSLFPFIREIVDSYQRGPRDRRAKNPLAPWLVICIVFALGLAVLSGKYVINLLEKEHELTLRVETLEHQLSMNAEVEAENLELRRAARLSERVTGKLTDDNKQLVSNLAIQTTKNTQLVSDNEKLTDLLDDRQNELTVALERIRLLEHAAEHLAQKPIEKPAVRRVVTPAVPVRPHTPVRYVSAHTLALVNELSK